MADGTSPVKRHRHRRNRHDVKRLHKVSNMNSSGRSLFDEGVDIDDEDGIFSFNSRTKLNAVQSEERSFLSLEPSKTEAFDFNSYLREITSEIKMEPKKIPGLAFCRGNSSILAFEKGKKLDLVADRAIITGDNLMDEWELDCVVRASEYDSDSEIRHLNHKDTGDNFGVNFSQLAESQERRAQDILNVEISTPTPKPTSELVPTSGFTFDPTLSLTKRPFTIFSDTLKSPESPSTGRTPSTPPPTARKITVCSPHHRTLRSPVKSNFKPVEKTLLNLIVESSDGDVDEAVKFATEINSLADLSIPLPQKTTELVNIPTNGPPDSSGHRRSAIISGVRPKLGKKRLQFTANDKENSNPRRFSHHLSQRRVMKDATNNATGESKRANGFYTFSEKSDYLKKRELVLTSSDEEKTPKRHGVKWADNLEW